MDCCVTLIVLVFGFSLSSCSNFPQRKYYYIDLPVSWAEAQHYCREKYTDLATIVSMDDINRLQPTISYSWAWIGLRDDPKSWRESMGDDDNSWKSSATGETSKTGYHNWAGTEPNNLSGDKFCVYMASNGEWFDSDCGVLLSFVCYTVSLAVTNQNGKTYVFISTPKTWSDARDYCREHHTDLPMIENSEENNEVFSAKPATARIWIGLYRVRWNWSDKTQSSFRYWRSNSPNNVGGNQFCISENTRHEWDDDACSTNYPFICHQVSKVKTAVRTKIETDADLTDPATNTQILQQFAAALTSQGWTDFKLRWKIQPRKQEKEKLTEPPCI